MQKEFEELLSSLTTQRDEIQLKIHLASMEVKQEFEGVENQWQQVKDKAADIADDSKDISDDVIATAKVVGEELQSAYQRISERLKD